MRNVVLFIAMSLDGFIADKMGGVDWLGGESSQEDDMQSYRSFIQNVDTIIMGYNTYHQLVTELSPNQWMYPDLTSYVITHSPQPFSKTITFTSQHSVDLVTELKEKNGKDIWICGGASIVNQLIRADLIDRYYINVMPTILGDGIRLFDQLENPRKLKLVTTKQYNGIIDLVYERR